MPVKLKGRVAVVTGASRGIGKGVALGLGEAGCTVYVTGKTLRNGDSNRPGSVTATADEVTKIGGRGIAVACDHRIDSETEKVFQRVQKEQNRLDILVNNATSYTTDIGPLKIILSGNYLLRYGMRCTRWGFVLIMSQVFSLRD